MKGRGKTNEANHKLHLVQCVKALKVYDPEPIAITHWQIRTVAIWAKDGVFEPTSETLIWKSRESVYDDGELLATGRVGLSRDWLTAKRSHFGPNGWEKLLGDQIRCIAVDGDHFSIMNPPRVGYEWSSFFCDFGTDELFTYRFRVPESSYGSPQEAFC